MPVKKFSPVTPGTRFRVGNAYSEVTTSEPEKSLLAPMRKTGGRNKDGKMTVRQKGGGHKRRYRVIDFKRDKDGVPATVKSIEYDPNRTAFIALLFYADGEKRYMIAPQGLQVGDTVVSGKGASPETGNTLFLSDIPLGSVIHAIELQPGQGAAIARSAGTNATLMGREGRYASVKLPSGEVRRILQTCKATIGSTSNPDHGLQVLGKAGRKRWIGRRPRVRGVAMNPVDHPMGGGEGRASGGHPRSRTGIMAKGQKTRNNKKHSTKLIISKRKSRNK
ncbi:50S ribosomal protein L2 [Flavilitoribacter nigricans]|uniref:Large ribosomal subunit protein uL2 n=1 Tax=Flavilitoribacter nigricans (strain ATCC 23147 / DSM 23189 / NBRC 102662 / NCIMB 1420 / SS-2) TaxID=1122177 RepID=A0A2D0N7S7_FLAN2|nr:50S ribosomal protein L2 [Flavilitoribacter nigricans]PHN04527.1 50S ribosomal protein L2 [Flavilitoribacter nigricans DSM 23189 = NBRC 102662]